MVWITNVEWIEIARRAITHRDAGLHGRRGTIPIRIDHHGACIAPRPCRCAISETVPVKIEAGARADLATVFDARRMALDPRLAALGAEAELARAWAQLAYLTRDGTRP